MIAIIVAAASATLAGGDDNRSLVNQLFERARKGDTAGLKLLLPEVQASGKSASRYAYHLARYIAEPSEYAAQFVSEFPENHAGIMGEVYEIEMERDGNGARLTPEFLYSFDELGKLAQNGHSDAVRKLFIVAGESDGVVAEFVCERIMKLLSVQPAKSTEALLTLPDDQRSKAYGCFQSASLVELDSAQSALSALPAGKDDKILAELLKAVRKVE